MIEVIREVSVGAVVAKVGSQMGSVEVTIYGSTVDVPPEELRVWAQELIQVIDETWPTPKEEPPKKQVKKQEIF